jgi:hypothetical protein
MSRRPRTGRANRAACSSKRAVSGKGHFTTGVVANGAIRYRTGCVLAATLFGEGGQGLFAMLISWIVLAIGHLSAGSLPLIDVTSNASRPVPSPITPGEPSTLIEALIGAGLIAAYFATTRRLRTRRETRRISQPVRAGSDRKAA